jgi:hypothetical protein
MKRREIAVVEFTLMLGALVFMAALLIPTTLSLCNTMIPSATPSHNLREQTANHSLDVATTLYPLTGPVAYIDWNDPQVLQ